MLRRQAKELINEVMNEIENDYQRSDNMIAYTDSAVRNSVEMEVNIAREKVLSLTDSLRMKMNTGGYGGRNQRAVEQGIKEAQYHSAKYFTLIDRIEDDINNNQ